MINTQNTTHKIKINLL